MFNSRMLESAIAMPADEVVKLAGKRDCEEKMKRAMLGWVRLSHRSFSERGIDLRGSVRRGSLLLGGGAEFIESSSQFPGNLFGGGGRSG